MSFIDRSPLTSSSLFPESRPNPFSTPPLPLSPFFEGRDMAPGNSLVFTSPPKVVPPVLSGLHNGNPLRMGELAVIDPAGYIKSLTYFPDKLHDVIKDIQKVLVNGNYFRDTKDNVKINYFYPDFLPKNNDIAPNQVVRQRYNNTLLATLLLKNKSTGQDESCVIFSDGHLKELLSPGQLIRDEKNKEGDPELSEIILHVKDHKFGPLPTPKHFFIKPIPSSHPLQSVFFHGKNPLISRKEGIFLSKRPRISEAPPLQELSEYDKDYPLFHSFLTLPNYRPTQELSRFPPELLINIKKCNHLIPKTLNYYSLDAPLNKSPKNTKRENTVLAVLSVNNQSQYVVFSSSGLRDVFPLGQKVFLLDPPSDEKVRAITFYARKTIASSAAKKTLYVSISSKIPLSEETFLKPGNKQSSFPLLPDDPAISKAASILLQLKNSRAEKFSP